jgi:SPX domain protein involved in polyphosphate accumulation
LEKAKVPQGKRTEEFVNWVDGEVKKIDEFCRSREIKCDARLRSLSDQMPQLQEYKYLPKRQPPEGLVRRSTKWFRSSAQSDIPEKVDYPVARERLREATLELYREMVLLQDYRVLNRKALIKILKKFDKVSKSKLSQEYQDKLRDMALEGEEISRLMDHTEVIHRDRLLIRISLLGIMNTAIEFMPSNALGYEKTATHIRHPSSEQAFLSAYLSPSLFTDLC